MKTLEDRRMSGKRLHVSAGMALLCGVPGAGQTIDTETPGNMTMPIWPGEAPGAKPSFPPATTTPMGIEHLVAGRPIIVEANVSKPTLTLFTAQGLNSGAAVVAFPGGGYNILAIDLEGQEVCDWLNSAGINCVLVKYRVPESGPYPKSSAALQDAQRALRFGASARSRVAH